MKRLTRLLFLLPLSSLPLFGACKNGWCSPEARRPAGVPPTPAEEPEAIAGEDAPAAAAVATTDSGTTGRR